MSTRGGFMMYGKINTVLGKKKKKKKRSLNLPYVESFFSFYTLLLLNQIKLKPIHLKRFRVSQNG